MLVGARQRQRIQLPRPDAREAAEPKAERVLQAREELGVVRSCATACGDFGANVQIKPNRPSDIGSSASGPDGVKRSYAT